jgi:phosphatidate cytidylyltransferase
LDLKKLGMRVVVAIFGIPIIVFLVLKGGLAFLALVLIINLLSQFEFYKLTELKKMLPLKILGLIGTFFLTISVYKFGTENPWIVIALVMGIFYAVLLVELFRNNGSATLNISSTTWGIFYPGFFFSFHILLRELPRSLDLPYAVGGKWILFMLVTIWICDTAAYFVGSTLGRHKLYQRVSPNKTVEGAVAGFVSALLTAYVFHLIYIKDLGLVQCLVIGGIVGIMSQVGDLVESVFKRDAVVKDTSGILPGHGGFLDRFDAPLFVAPLVYFYLRFLVFAN